MTKKCVCKVKYLLLLIALSIFLILKMRRGFSGDEEQGGIWNYIQLLFVGCGAITIMKSPTIVKSFSCLCYYFIFSVIVWTLALFGLANYYQINIPVLYRFFLVPYGFLCMFLFYKVGLSVDFRKYRYLLVGTFYIIFFILYTSIRGFRIETTDNIGAISDVYYVVGLLPLILAFTSKKYSLIPFLVSVAAVMMTGKRTGFVILVGVLFIYFLSTHIKGKGLIKILSTLTFFAIVSAVTYFMMNYLVESYNLNIYKRLENMGIDGGSGRMTRWNYIFSKLAIDINAISFIFGHGFRSVVNTVGGHAHNDFIEILYDYGIVALIFYMMFFVSLIRETLKMYKKKFLYVKEFACSVIIALCLAMFSFYFVDATYITCSSVCLGLLLAEWKKYERNDTTVYTSH